MEHTQKSAVELLNRLESELEIVFVKKAPALSESNITFLVRYLPWLIVVILVCSVPIVLIGLGLAAFITPLAIIAGPYPHSALSVSFVLFLIIVALLGVGIKDIFAQRQRGWKFLFYAGLVNALYVVLSFDPFSIVFMFLSIYATFQIKKSYTK